MPNSLLLIGILRTARLRKIPVRSAGVVCPFVVTKEWVSILTCDAVDLINCSTSPLTFSSSGTGVAPLASSSFSANIIQKVAEVTDEVLFSIKKVSK